MQVQAEKQELQLERKLVGTETHRVDALPKVTGGIVYTRDMTLPNMLHGKIKRCNHPHARIISINYDDAARVPGVKAVVTGRDFPPMKTEETPAMANNLVLYRGQAVAAAAAETRKAAEECLEAITPEYDTLAASLDPEAALSSSSALIQQEGVTSRRPNVGRHVHVEKGDAEAAFKTADFIFEEEYKTSAQTHFAMEPITFVAKPELDGGVTIWGTASSQHKLQAMLSRYLGLEMSRIRVVVPFVGGLFGSKEDMHVAAICARLALKARRPVKLELSREESIIGGAIRHPSVIRIRDGVSKQGRIAAREIEAIFDGGAYGRLGNDLLRNAALAATNIYKLPNFRMDAYRVYTNRVPGTSMRSPYSTQVVFAVESQMEKIAHELKMDPVRFRDLNLLEEGDETALGERIEGICHKQALSEVKEKITRRRTPDEGPWKTGLGFAVGAKFSSAGPYGASLKLRQDGIFEIWSGVIENGAGSLTSLCQLVADEFGVPMHRVRIMPLVLGADSSLSNVEQGSTGSRQLVNHGRALLIASQQLKEKIAVIASRQLGANQAEIEFSGGKARVKSDWNRHVDISAIAGDPKLTADDLTGTATWNFPLGTMDELTGQAKGGKLCPYFVTAVQAAEVSVNIETGRVRVNRIVAAMDAGKAINPALVRGQIAGSVAFGVGATLGEGLSFDGGAVVNPNLADYKVMTAVDMPPVDTIILETGTGDGPFGAKGAGEASVLPTAAAIRNAVHDAAGVWVNNLPVSSAEVLIAMQGKGRSK